MGTKQPTKQLTLMEKLTAKFLKMGVGKRKAAELAKAAAPVARNAVKAEIAQKRVPQIKKTLTEIQKKVAKSVEQVGTTLYEPPSEPVEPKKSTKAKVDSERDKPDIKLDAQGNPELRTDLSIVSYTGVDGRIDLMRVMHGISSSATYIVAAVLGAVGILAVRRLGSDRFNVKFYPTMEHWNVTQEQMRSLNAHDFLKREWYERMHFNREGLDQLLARLKAEEMSRESAKKGKIRRFVDRLRAVTFRPFLEAFDKLYSRGVSSQAS